jgi:hypothetical protein
MNAFQCVAAGHKDLERHEQSMSSG